MSLLEMEVNAKKQLVYGARHRVSGSKSKRCSLPSDNLTDAQMRKKNGEVFSVNLNRPMKYEQFLALPDDLKVEYIEGLREKYGVGKSHIQKMLGVGPYKMNKICDELKIACFPTGGVRKMKKDMLSQWEQFVGRSASPVTLQEPDQFGLGNSIAGRKNQTEKLAMTGGHINFSGSVKDICNTLLALFGPDSCVQSMTVAFTAQSWEERKEEIENA